MLSPDNIESQFNIVAMECPGMVDVEQFPTKPTKSDQIKT